MPPSHTTVCTCVYGGFFKVIYDVTVSPSYVPPRMQKAIQDLPFGFGRTIRVHPPQKGGCLFLVLPSDSSGNSTLFYPVCSSTILAFTTSKKKLPRFKDSALPSVFITKTSLVLWLLLTSVSVLYFGIRSYLRLQYRYRPPMVS